jgi:hypothetical protein
MIGTRYEPSGCAGSSPGVGNSRHGATAVPTSSIAWIWLAGRPSNAAVSVGSYRASPGAAAGLGADAKLGAPARRALGAEETGAGRRVTTSQDRSQIGLGHLTRQAEGVSAPAPSGPVPRRHRRSSGPGPPHHRRSQDRRGRGSRVAGSGSGRCVDDLGHRPAGAAQRCDRKPHRVTLGGRPAGAPQGHLQGCARWVCGWGTTVGDPRGTRSGRRRGTGGRVMVGGRGRG